MYIRYNKFYSNVKNNSFKEEDIFISRVPLIIFNEGINKGINEGINLLLKIIIQHEGKRTNELATIIKTPVKTVERWISKLKKENKITYIGSKKTGGYFFKKE